MIVINLFGGPGVGKSTRAAELFLNYKKAVHSVEIVPEVVKHNAYTKTIPNQFLTIGKTVEILEAYREGKVSVVINECPLLQMALYAEEQGRNYLTTALLEENARYDNDNRLLLRRYPYNPQGRVHTEKEALHYDTLIKEFLHEYRIPYTIDNPKHPY
jgi:bifunctional pyridoxal-dependent enzyme with beta-cystathionase and maltose regulon repressor activities